MALKKWTIAILLTTATVAQTPSFKRIDLTTSCPPLHIVTGDFDGDGKSDIAILCDTADDLISVLLGNGDGTFQAPVLTSFPRKDEYMPPLVTADFNRDGKSDLATLEQAGILVFLATGSGKFQSPILVPAPDQGSLVAADVNGDGNPDLISWIVGPSYLTLGKGNGTFAAPVPVPIGLNRAIEALVVSDFNGDGIPDLFFSTLPSGGSNDHETYLRLGTGAGGFSPPNLLAGFGGQSLTVGDFNCDGRPDVVISGIWYDANSYTLLGKGDGTFQPRVAIQGFYGPFAAADLNADCKTDLVQKLATSAIAILISQGDGSFQPIADPVQVAAVPQELAIADFNGDGLPDIAVQTPAGISILLNTTPFKSLAGILNAASFARGQPVAPGSLISIFGTGFSSATVQASALPLPTSLGGVSITFNGTPAPLSFVSQNQINAQVPWNASGTVNVAVTANGTTFSPFQLQTAAMAPGIFSLQSGADQAIAINPDGSLAGPEDSIPGLAVHPANAGDPLIILATGLGAVSPSISNGAASTDALRNAVTMPSALIGGEPAQVLFAGLSPQFVGVNQINVVVPQVAAPGVVPLQIRSGGITTSDKVTIAVQNP